MLPFVGNDATFDAHETMAVPTINMATPNSILLLRGTRDISSDCPDRRLVSSMPIDAPEWPARGNTARQKRRYALQAAILLSAGVEPEEVSWWRSDDLWFHAFDAVIMFVRAASERRQVPVAAICTALRRG